MQAGPSFVYQSCGAFQLPRKSEVGIDYPLIPPIFMQIIISSNVITSSQVSHWKRYQLTTHYAAVFCNYKHCSNMSMDRIRLLWVRHK